jgi:hypothetical protein
MVSADRILELFFDEENLVSLYVFPFLPINRLTLEGLAITRSSTLVFKSLAVIRGGFSIFDDEADEQ